MIDEHNNACFIVKDATWQALGYFYFEEEFGRRSTDVRFSNRPFGVKHFQTIHRYSVDVAHGLVLLFGIGTKALVWGFFSQEVFMQSGTSFSFVGFLVRSESPFLRPQNQATP